MATYGIPTKGLHEQWLDLVQPVGLVVAPAVLSKLELVPNQSTPYLSARQRQLEALLQEVDGPGGQLPDDLQNRIDEGKLFFNDPNDALDFQGQLQAYGAITGRRKLPWRYRWPDDVRDEVLALNAERYDKEVRLGLHSKGAKGAARAAASAGGATGRRRGRPAKAAQAGEAEASQSEQMGLGL